MRLRLTFSLFHLPLCAMAAFFFAQAATGAPTSAGGERGLVTSSPGEEDSGSLFLRGGMTVEGALETGSTPNWSSDISLSEQLDWELTPSVSISGYVLLSSYRAASRVDRDPFSYSVLTASVEGAGGLVVTAGKGWVNLGGYEWQSSYYVQPEYSGYAMSYYPVPSGSAGLIDIALYGGPSPSDTGFRNYVDMQIVRRVVRRAEGEESEAMPVFSSEVLVSSNSRALFQAAAYDRGRSLYTGFGMKVTPRPSLTLSFDLIRDSRWLGCSEMGRGVETSSTLGSCSGDRVERTLANLEVRTASRLGESFFKTSAFRSQSDAMAVLNSEELSLFYPDGGADMFALGHSVANCGYVFCPFVGLAAASGGEVPSEGNLAGRDGASAKISFGLWGEF